MWQADELPREWEAAAEQVAVHSPITVFDARRVARAAIGKFTVEQFTDFCREAACRGVNAQWMIDMIAQGGVSRGS